MSAVCPLDVCPLDVCPLDTACPLYALQSHAPAQKAE